ncbi:Protein CBR-SRXA-18 [Caenorhabditis briggsae]|uniref:Protein CBR-SRXA-18 n=1 Tax=Caenorhabditis briggsae TaxID=6238 RepID=A8X8W8_CAEBR|nr:Protein CBR-SRXA-18 [Caenorhabditis briggsae]CAP29079.1 Protein CBR-SRXA-18 [Caenorhabditis briggsae]
MAYQAKFFIAILMAVNRLWVVLIPIGSEAFSTKRLKIYMVVGWAILFFRQMIIIVPDDCYFKMDLIQFQVMAVCEDKEKHAFRMKINSYISKFIHILLPWSSVFVNILVVLILKFRKRKNKMATSKGENSLVINSLVVSLLLTANYIYNDWYTKLKPTISQQSHEIQSLLSLFNLYGCTCFNFIVYFLLDPTNRKNFIDTLKNRKPNQVVTRIVTTML